jgi:hypothetical protein
LLAEASRNDNLLINFNISIFGFDEYDFWAAA